MKANLWTQTNEEGKSTVEGGGSFGNGLRGGNFSLKWIANIALKHIIFSIGLISQVLKHVN